MPGTPMEQDNKTLGKVQDELPPNTNYDPPVLREITQTDRLNKKLLVSLLERMNKSEGEFDRFMDTAKTDNTACEDSDF